METNNQADQLAIEINDENVAVRLGMPRNGDISTGSINSTVKLSRYQQISTRTPMCAIVINNTTFDTSSTDRRDPIGDVEKLGILRDYGFVFHLCPDHCTADEMYSILVILALSKKIKDSLVQVTKAKNVSEALERFLVDDEVKVAMRHLTNNECIVAMHTVLRNQQMHKIVIDLLETPLSEYYGLTLFIMMHGGEGGKLIGADGNCVSTHKVVSLFSASNCPSLVDKPKIFVMQIRKGSREFANTRSINDIQIPDEPDFLFLYSSTTESIDATPDEDKSLFVNSLVEVLNERLKSQHFEDALLWVKDKIASSPYGVKEIPLVVSQMRDKLWFHL